MSHENRKFAEVERINEDEMESMEICVQCPNKLKEEKSLKCYMKWNQKIMESVWKLMEAMRMTIVSLM